MTSRRSFLQFLALAPFATSASAKVLSSFAPLDSNADLRQLIREEASEIDVVGTYPRGMTSCIIQCDEIGYFIILDEFENPIRGHSPEFQAMADSRRMRDTNFLAL